MGNRAVICTVAAVLLACGVRASGERMRVDLRFDPMVMASVRSTHASSTRQAVAKIVLPGFCSSLSSGNPALPCRLVYIALPPNTDLSSVRVQAGSYSTSVLPGSYDIAPVPAIAASARAAEFGLGKRIVAGRNSLVYGRNEFYPREQVRVTDVGRLRTWKIAALEFWPYSYNPATGKLRVIKAGSAEVDYSITRSGASPAADEIAPSMADFVSNQSEASTWYRGMSTTQTAPTPGYAIITTNAIKSASAALAQFASFQADRGYSVRIVTESDWGGGIGDTAAERIRAWLKANYLALGLQYVLLIGNPNPTSGDVPMKMLWPRNWSSSYKEAPSDYYYSDLTGNWDRDGDGYYGEEPDDFGVGGIDRIPEVYVGRIPYYGSAASLDSILRKTVAYESNAQAAWCRTLLLAMKPMDSDTPSYQLGEQILRDIGWYAGLTPDRIYDATYGLSMPPEYYPCGYGIVQSEWAKGAGLVFWMTHGSTNTAGSVFTSSRCDYLDDSKPAIVYMASCSNGKPEDSGNLGYCVLAKGGVTTFSASRVSWYYIMETDFTHSDSIGGLGYQYARFLLGGSESCGRAAMDARLANPMAIWANHLVYNLYGDPSLFYSQPRTAQAVASVAAAKELPDGARVYVTEALMSRAGSGQVYYIQDANRCAGIRVTGVWGGIGSPTDGANVAVTGTLGTDKGMRVITDAEVAPTGGSEMIRPLGMSARSIGLPKGFGLLVAVWGRVLSSSTGGFTISGLNRKVGSEITCYGNVPTVSLGSQVRVVGVSTPDGIAVCGAGDVTVILN